MSLDPDIDVSPGKMNVVSHHCLVTSYNGISFDCGVIMIKSGRLIEDDAKIHKYKSVRPIGGDIMPPPPMVFQEGCTGQFGH